MRDSRHDILFEPLRLGPVTAPNRFYQVPHCTGMGWRRPRSLAAMRGVKAEGGWGVVNTEYCSIHPTSDNDYYAYCALWDDSDIRAHRLMTDAVHAHGALAGVELWAGGGMIVNHATRLPPMGLRSLPQTDDGEVQPGQTRPMDLTDIADLRRWHRDAALRAVEAGFDIVYVYATHGYLLSQFLDARTNTRTDAYGGPLENRVRLVRELIEDTREALSGRAAVACRFSVGLEDAESYDAFGLLADLPDLWDLTVPDYDIEMSNSRFVRQGALTESVARAKALTDRPVVAVGRFTDPDMMAQVIRSGAQDMIGAARPSIADPFLPLKIREGRSADIRECIGCNICYAHDSQGVPIRCTQNPTMGDEWRLGWHPERLAAAPSAARVLVVGGGPAGLEAARVLGARGHEVMLAEARRVMGGRVTRESALPGLSEWARVRDWRLGQIAKMDNVTLYPESRIGPDDLPAMSVDHLIVATGAHWADDTVGRNNPYGLHEMDRDMIVSADDVLAGHMVEAEHIAIYDDDHYYHGSVLALALRRAGHDVMLVTPAGRVCEWGTFTQEQYASTAALIAAGVRIVTNRVMTQAAGGAARLACPFGGADITLACDAVLPLTRRIPDRTLYDAVRATDHGLQSISLIGDAEAPGLIAAAVYSGHRAGMELGETVDLAARYGRRETSV
ncbi:NADH:flavin oxidoreductase [Sulfitobacter alexandrii]|uniref:NADH:flavin oxidoreductase n=1 Tax=Sulfitobacter alexandrii TaxID=1917485 RepID=A0A1J0WFZ8_9RHOB|nr:FAD-dependent oxidoreductase [Sulfitobacter alexandrii]APE43227.1 NADH:flavin oxidoreductase [Sulfitobacter alexandrii]